MSVAVPVQAESRNCTFPNKISRIFLLALNDVLGDNNMLAVLNTARLPRLVEEFPPANFEPGLTFEEVVDLFEALESIYGQRGGRKVAHQAGQACFKYGIEGFGGLIGFADFFLRILPVGMRVRIGLEVLREIFNRYSDQHIAVGEGESAYVFVSEQCGMCWQRHADGPVCALMAGLLEETLYWISRGQRFAIEETACIARGDPNCTFYIQKTPTSSQ